MTRYSWQDIPSVAALSRYLKDNRQHGFSIVLLNGDPALHCHPGVTPAETERWEVLNKALGMFRAAEADLRHLVVNRMMKIPGHPGWR